MPRLRSKLVGLTIALAIALLPVCAREAKTSITPPSHSASIVAATTSASASESASASASESASASASASGPRDVVIYPNPDPDDKHFDKPSAYPEGEDKRILDRMFGKGHYLPDMVSCKPPDFHGGEGPEQATKRDREAGNFTPWLFDVVEGSFTGVGRHETIYVTQNHECDVGWNWGTSTLAVYDGKSIIARAVVRRGIIVNIIDIDGDGQEEIVFEGVYINMGVTEDSPMILRFEGDKLMTVKDFGPVSRDECGGPANMHLEDKEATIHLLTRADGKCDFRVDTTTKPCVTSKPLEPSSTSASASASAPASASASAPSPSHS